MPRLAVAIPLVLALAAPSGAARATGGTFDPSLGVPGAPARTLSSEDIREIQRRLTALGYRPGPEDGTANPDTQKAIAAWQADHGEAPTGLPSLALEKRLAAVSMLPHPGEPAPPASAAQLQRWRQGLVGRPAVGSGGDAVGRIVSVETSTAGIIAGVLVAVDLPNGGTRLVPLVWQWVVDQIGLPAVVVPWSRVDFDWLMAGGNLPAATATPVRDLAGRRPSWLDGAEADLAGGERFGTVDGFQFSSDGQVEAIYVRPSPDGPDYPVPRRAVHVVGEGAAARLVISMTRPQVLALLSAPVSPPLAAVPPAPVTPPSVRPR